jgi:hypothetical protein
MCPITQEVMKDPVIAADGHSYERAAIEKWFKTKRAPPTSPSTNLALPHTLLVPNHALKAAIEDHLQKHGRSGEGGAQGSESDSDSDHPLAAAAALVRSARPKSTRRARGTRNLAPPARPRSRKRQRTRK